jgi:hypothetical protein
MEPNKTNDDDAFRRHRDTSEGSPAVGASASPSPSVLIQGNPAELRQAAEDVLSSAEELYRVADVFVGKQAQQRPYVVLGTALGIGFVLGGGLATRLGGRLVSFGGKMLVSRALEGFFEEGLEKANGFVSDDD